MDVKEELKFFVKIHKNFFFRVGSGWGGGGGVRVDVYREVKFL